MGTNRPRPMIDRLIAKLDVGLCWEFTGCTKPNGYGTIQRNYPERGLIRTHRAMWLALVGPIPTGLDLDHLCRNRKCCNPDHLEPVTRKENVRRGATPGRKRSDACGRGHPYTPANTITRKNGARACRTCTNAYQRRRRAEKRMVIG